MAVLWMTLVSVLSLQLVTGELENVALRKPTNASSLYKTSNASNGVDGDKKGNKKDIYLMHTDENQIEGWWTVDLERDVVDAEVKIYFRTNYKRRRNGVQLYTSQTPFSSYPGGQLCHEVSGRADGRDIPDVVRVNCTGTWRYLMVYIDTRNEYDKGPMLDFSEVEVLVCTDGTYGVDCSKSCCSRRCSDQSSPCERFTGTCVGGCDAGWTGGDCAQECADGMFGYDCTSTCGKCHGGEACDHVTGQCRAECQPGYKAQHCSEKCPQRTYGAGCRSTCGHCYQGNTCHHVTGHCTRGCGAGWMGQLCMQGCTDMKYGMNCSQSCGQCREQCDPEDGRCFGGCVDGSGGSHCKDQLPTDK